MKRITALVLSAALAAGIFSGCGKQDPEAYIPTGNGLYQESETEPVVAEDEKLRLSMPYYPNRLFNPFQCTDYTNKAILSLLYQGLFALDQDYESWPILCQSYQVSWDMKTWTFTLADATFTDGTAVTAQDVAASLKAAKKSDVYKGRFTYLDDISVTEDGQVKIDLEVPCENLPALLDVPVVKASEVDASMPMGSGPYVLVPGNQPVLQRRPDWWCSGSVPVTAKQIRLVEAGTPSELRDAFEFSNLSMVPTDPGSDNYADFHSDYELWESENGIFLYLACNPRSDALSQTDIRQSLVWAIDREGIINECYRGFATAALLPASPNSPCYDPGLAEQYSYNPMMLTQAVEEYRDKVTQDLIMLVNSDDSVRVRVAAKIAQQLKKCGLKVTILEQPSGEYEKTLQKGEFDLYLGQTRLSPNMDLSAFFSSDGRLSFGGMADAKLHSLCLDALANIGNYYNLHQEVMKSGRLCPILFRSYAIYTQRGSFRGLTPSRDNLFFYHLGRTCEDALITQ